MKLQYFSEIIDRDYLDCEVKSFISPNRPIIEGLFSRRYTRTCRRIWKMENLVARLSAPRKK